MNLGLVLFIAILSSQLANAAAIDGIINSEISRLGKKYDLHAKVIIGSEADTSARPDGVVYVNRDQLSKLLPSETSVSTDDIYRFIIGHEMVHELQFKLYGNNVLSSGFRRRMYECQADMLASEDLIEEGTLDKQRGEALKEVVRTAVLAGTEVYSADDHPSSDQRRIAVQYGLARGLLVLESAKSDATRSTDAVEALRRAIDWKQGESDTDWALRISRRITHQDFEAASALVSGDPAIHWNTGGEHPFVNYAIPFTNSSARPIHVEVQIQSVSAPRFNSSDALLWQRVDDQTYEFDLRAAETRTVSGTLQWYATDELMPRILVPPTSGTLYSARFTDNADTSARPSGTALSENPNTDNVASTILKYLNNADKKYQDFIAAQIAERIDFGDGDYSDIYPATQQFPGATATKIWHSKDGSAYVFSDLYDGYSGKSGWEHFNQYDQILKQIYARRDGTPPTEKECKTRAFVSYAVGSSPDATKQEIRKSRDFVYLSLKPRSGGRCVVDIRVERESKE